LGRPYVAALPPRTRRCYGRLLVRDTFTAMEIKTEPATREVRIVQKGPLWIAVPVEAGPPLSGAIVEQVRRETHQRGV
jgi:hypothetical protein